MIQGLAQFLVYTLAMIGVLVIGCVVYRKTMYSNPIQKNSMLKIVDLLRLPDRKILYVVQCKNEQFLLASSNDKVTLISQLNSKNNQEDIERYLKEKQDSEGVENQSKKTMINSLLKELSDKNRAKRGNY